MHAAVKINERNNTEIPTTSHEPNLERRNPYTITSDILIKRLNQKNNGRFITQLCVAVIYNLASMAALSFGIVLGWSTPAAIRVLLVTEEGTKKNLTQRENVVAASLMPLGCSIGIMPWSYSVKKIGPKRTMILQTPFHIFILLIKLTFKKYETYVITRLLSGFFSISFIIAGECLLTDSIHRGNYSLMIVFFHSSVLLGVLCSYVVGHFLPKIWLILICMGIPAVNLVTLFFIPESPVFLYDKNQLKAEKALSWYRGRENISVELRYIKKDSELRKAGTEIYKHMIYSKVVVKAVLITMGLTFFQVFSGYYAFIFYNVLLWRMKSTYVFNLFTDSTIFGVSMYVSNFVGNYFHYRTPYRVRAPLVLSSCLVATTLTVVTIYLVIHWYWFHLIKHVQWIPFVSLNAFFFSYEVGLGTCPGIILSEYLPYQVYPAARIFVRVFFWLLVYVLTRCFILVRNLTNNYVIFSVLTVIAYMNVAYCSRFVIESKGKTLHQLQMEIGGNPIGNRSAYRTRYGELRRSFSLSNEAVEDYDDNE